MRICIIATEIFSYEITMFEYLNRHKVIYIANYIDDRVKKSSKHTYLERFNIILRQRKRIPFPFSSYLKHFSLLPLNDIIKECDIILTSEIFTSLSALCNKIAKSLGIKHLIRVLETIPLNPGMMTPIHLYNIAKSKNADLFLPFTPYSYKYLLIHGIPQNKIRLLPHSVDCNMFHPSSKNNRKIIKILFVGRLIRYKGIEYLLKAFRIIYKRRRDVELIICGDGKFKHLVLEYAKDFPIRYLGKVPHNKLPIIYQNADIFVLPSHERRVFGLKVWEEQFGYVLAEAMASGLPIVSSNTGAIPEVIGRHNMIVHNLSEESLAKSIMYLIKNEKVRLHIGRLNRKRALRLYNADRNARIFEKIIDELY